MARLKDYYSKTVVPALIKEFNYKNPMQVPKMEKIVINMGLGSAIENVKIIDGAVQELATITGQKPVITKAKKSIATFKLRQGMSIGCSVTLRKEMMYEFFDRLVAAALPRIRDFRGLSPRKFDGRGNYTFGVAEQTIFPEIELEKVKRTQGMDITIVTSSPDDAQALELLKMMGFPFAEAKEAPVKAAAVVKPEATVAVKAEVK